MRDRVGDRQQTQRASSRPLGGQCGPALECAKGGAHGGGLELPRLRAVRCPPRVEARPVVAEDVGIDGAECRVDPSLERPGVDVGSQPERGVTGIAAANAVGVHEVVGWVELGAGRGIGVPEPVQEALGRCHRLGLPGEHLRAGPVDVEDLGIAERDGVEEVVAGSGLRPLDVVVLLEVLAELPVPRLGHGPRKDAADHHAAAASHGLDSGRVHAVLSDVGIRDLRDDGSARILSRADRVDLGPHVALDLGEPRLHVARCPQGSLGRTNRRADVVGDGASHGNGS